MLRKLRIHKVILLTQDLLVSKRVTQDLLVSKRVELKLRSKIPKASVLPLHQLVCFLFKAYNLVINFPLNIKIFSKVLKVIKIKQSYFIIKF